MCLLMKNNHLRYVLFVSYYFFKYINEINFKKVYLVLNHFREMIEQILKISDTFL